MKFLKEFKEFINRGNVLDMAVGVIIAGAFGKITASLVNDVIMPFIGWIFGGTDLTEKFNIVLKEGTDTTEPTVLGLGTLLGVVIDFIIVAFVVFMIVKAFNKARSIAEKRKAVEEAAEEKEEESAPTEAELLAEIRDLLKESKK